MRIWLTLAAGFLALSTAASQTIPNKEAKSMMATDLDRLIQAKNWSAVQLCSQSGPALVPALDPYLRSPDEVVRLLAVDCIGAAGGPQAPPLLVRALADSNEQVRNDAVNALHQNLPVGHERELLVAWDGNRTRDTYVRQQIPMILGLMHANNRVADLKVRLNADPRQDVRDGVLAGLAKLGDAPARSSFGALLRDARGKRTAELMELVRYLDEPWVIPYLAPVLERRNIAVDLSTHRKQLRRRECDLAVDEVVRISKAPFSFPIDATGQYSDPQIEEALRYARAWRQ
jgi:hypothetical protein